MGNKQSSKLASAIKVDLVILGSHRVGKSSIGLRFTRGEFKENEVIRTVGVDFLTRTVSISGQSVKFIIWDFSGQERCDSLVPMYYRTARAVVIVYDITSKESFSRATDWVKELQQQTTDHHIVQVLVGNKVDLASEKRAVSKEDASAFAEENDLLFLEMSAKTGLYVEDVFMTIAEIMVKLNAEQPFQIQGNPDIDKIDVKK